MRVPVGPEHYGMSMVRWLGVLVPSRHRVSPASVWGGRHLSRAMVVRGKVMAVQLELPLPQVPLGSGPRLQPRWPCLRLGPSLLGRYERGAEKRQAAVAQTDGR
jgi:hypothetical protein